MTDKLRVTVDMDALTIGDLELFEKWQGGGYKASELIAFLSRVAKTETPIREMPMSSLKEILAAIQEAVGEAQNPKN